MFDFCEFYIDGDTKWYIKLLLWIIWVILFIIDIIIFTQHNNILKIPEIMDSYALIQPQLDSLNTDVWTSFLYSYSPIIMTLYDLLINKWVLVIISSLFLSLEKLLDGWAFDLDALFIGEYWPRLDFVILLFWIGSTCVCGTNLLNKVMEYLLG